jgi:uncharacterized repeat protein (TIGR01451 family)
MNAKQRNQMHRPAGSGRSEARALSSAAGRRYWRRGLLVAITGLASVWLLAAPASAVGTAAGTPIQNQATATYTVGVTPLSVSTLVNTLAVDELVDVTVTLLSAPVPVIPNDTNRVLAFRVTNTGNGSEVFELVALSSALGGDFDPILAAQEIYLDDGDGSFDILLDAPYTIGVDDPTLDANIPLGDSIVVFVLNDFPVPPLVLVDGDQGLSRLTATAVSTGAQVPGTTVANGGDGGLIDAVVGTTGAQGSQEGTYIVAAVSVGLTKTAAVLPDATFGTQPVPGATIRYTITVTVTGSGTATGLVVTDAIPVGTIYEALSIYLNAVNLSDGADLDAGDFNVTNPGAITVDLGDVAGGNPDNVITFDAMIDPT